MDTSIYFDSELLRRYDVNGPRYTSYPTAAQFNNGFDPADYEGAARRSNEDPIPAPLSPYGHIPFKDRAVADFLMATIWGSLCPLLRPFEGFPWPSPVRIRTRALTCSSCAKPAAAVLWRNCACPWDSARKIMERLDALVKPSSPLHAGEYLYRVGDPFKSLYAVHSGYFKTYAYDDSGREQVLGFHLPGELMGLGAIYPDHHVANAVALDTATVCRLQYSELSALAAQIPSLQKQLFRLMSKDIRGLQALSGDYTAEERLASFLMSLSSRLHLRGYSAAEFLLAMKRRDIANYLRLATETVSRVFAKFQEDGLISVERREVRILDLPRLSDACHNVPHV